MGRDVREIASFQCFKWSGRLRVWLTMQRCPAARIVYVVVASHVVRGKGRQMYLRQIVAACFLCQAKVEQPVHVRTCRLVGLI